MMELICPSCNSNNLTCIGNIPSSNHFAGMMLDYVLPGGKLYGCNNCFLHFRWPQLPQEQLGELYLKADYGAWQYESGNRVDWQIAANWLNTISSRGDILDIGCFDGNFLDSLGKKWRKFGVEINEGACRKAAEKGVTIISKDFKQISGLPKHFDAVVAFDVIEHVKDPGIFLQQIANVTRTDGVIILSSGNTQAPSWKFLGSRYWYCTLSEHISFINERWCFNVAQDLNIEIENLDRFSHSCKRRNFSGIIFDLMKNLLYKFSPGTFMTLRKIGSGKTDITIKKEGELIPPFWMMAKDHLIVCFRKK